MADEEKTSDIPALIPRPIDADEAQDSPGTEMASKALGLSAEERTLPRRLKCMDPDMIIVVGGVEFFHFKSILCSFCPFFDNMLFANMKESKESRIEFLDKDPDEWMMVYKYLTLEGAEAEKQLRAGMLAGERPCDLLAWFDYLGCDHLLKICDEVAANRETTEYKQENIYPGYGLLNRYKDLPCPSLKRAMKNEMKLLIEEDIARNVSENKHMIPDLQPYLLDDVCGEELWSFLLSKVRFPEDMLEELDRETIVGSPTFKFFLQALCERK
jgi:hypothetical protein